jgi:hypothetical protein
MIWLVLALCLATLLGVVVALCLWPITLRVSVRGRGDADGMWSAAGGVEFGPASFTGVRARGVPGRVNVHLLGWQIASKSTAKDTSEEAKRKAELKRAKKRRARKRKAEARPKRSLEERIASLTAWAPAKKDVTLIRRVLRWTRYDYVAGRFEYSLDDVVLAGRIYAALTVVGALSPPGVRLSHACDWMGAERLDGELSGQWKVWPVPLLMAGVLWWMSAPRRGRI